MRASWKSMKQWKDSVVRLGLAAAMATSMSACGLDVDGLDGQIDAAQSLLRALLEDGQSVLGVRILDKEGDQEERTYYTNHPIRIGVVFEGATEVKTDQVLIGIVEEHPSDISEAARYEAGYTSCSLGGFPAEYAGIGDIGDDLAALGVVYLEDEFVVGDNCIPEGKDEMTFNIWIGVNAAMVTNEADAENTSEDDLNTYFFNEWYLKKQQADGEKINDQCHLINGDDAANWNINNLPIIENSAGCVVSLTIKRNPGRDLIVEEIVTDSVVAVVDVASDYNPFPEDLTAMADAELESVETFLSAEIVLSLQGVEKIFDPSAGDERPANALDDLATDSDPLSISFTICPAETEIVESEDDFGNVIETVVSTGNCLDDALDIAVIDDEGVPMADLPVTDMVAGDPVRLPFTLMIEEGSDLQAAFAATEGVWVESGLFLIEGCANIPFEEVAAANLNVDPVANNCGTLDIAVKRNIVVAAASEYGYRWGKSEWPGNDIIRAGYDFSSNHWINTSGAFSHTDALGGIRGWFSMNLVKAWAHADVYVSVVGTGYNFGLEIIGIKVAGESKSIEAYEYSPDLPQYGKYVSFSKSYGIAGVGLDISANAGATVGIDVTIGVDAEDEYNESPFDVSTRVGKIYAEVTPRIRVGLDASASVSILVARGGASGHLDLFWLGFPFTAELRWGLQNLNPFKLAVRIDMGMDFVVKILNGNLYVWAEVVRPAWCGCGSWCPGYPCSSWARVYDGNIVSFSAWEVRIPIWHMDPFKAYIP